MQFTQNKYFTITYVVYLRDFSETNDVLHTESYTRRARLVI